jgi:mono/diheme cytochrome c family protein
VNKRLHIRTCTFLFHVALLEKIQGVSMSRFIKRMTSLALLGLTIAWFLSAPKYVDATEFDNLTADLAAGEQVFYAGGCASCHSAPKTEGEAKLVLQGGKEFPSDFGTFVAPNISPDLEQGVGGWSAVDLANAMLMGVSPEGQHYYPAFPYTSYQRMTAQDIVDLHGFLATLPASQAPSEKHQVGFPFDVRRTLGLWKLMFVKSGPVANLESAEPDVLRGQYLVEGPGHCSECHTSRNALGGLDHSKWMAGAPNPDGPGRIPNVTDHETGLADWTAADIAEYLKSGFTPSFDTTGGSMVDVVENTAHLSDADRAAIGAYLKAIPALPKAP